MHYDTEVETLNDSDSDKGQAIYEKSQCIPQVLPILSQPDPFNDHQPSMNVQNNNSQFITNQRFFI